MQRDVTFRVQPFVHDALLSDGNISLQLPLKGLHYSRAEKHLACHHVQSAIQEQFHRHAQFFRAW